MCKCLMGTIKMERHLALSAVLVFGNIEDAKTIGFVMFRKCQD